jgi:hypothetical protein
MKKSFVLKVCVLTSLLLGLTSCFTMVKVPEAVDYSGYVGFNEKQLIREFGSPKFVLSDLADGKVFVYEKDSSLSVSKAPQKSQFFINNSGIVYKCLSNETKDVLKRKFSVGKFLGLVIPLTIGLPIAASLVLTEL